MIQERINQFSFCYLLGVKHLSIASAATNTLVLAAIVTLAILTLPHIVCTVKQTQRARKSNRRVDYLLANLGLCILAYAVLRFIVELDLTQDFSSLPELWKCRGTRFCEFLSTSLIGIVSWTLSREKVVSPGNDDGNIWTLGTWALVVLPWFGSLFIASFTLGSSLSNYSDESETVNGNSSSVESHLNSTDSPRNFSCTLSPLFDSLTWNLIFQVLRYALIFAPSTEYGVRDFKERVTKFSSLPTVKMKFWAVLCILRLFLCIATWSAVGIGSILLEIVREYPHYLGLSWINWALQKIRLFSLPFFISCSILVFYESQPGFRCSQFCVLNSIDIM